MENGEIAPKEQILNFTWKIQELFLLEVLRGVVR